MAANVLDKFLRYVVIDTQSVEDSSTYPSTAKQWDLLQLLERELREIGLPEVRIDEYGTSSPPFLRQHPRPTCR